MAHQKSARNRWTTVTTTTDESDDHGFEKMLGTIKWNPRYCGSIPETRIEAAEDAPELFKGVSK